MAMFRLVKAGLAAMCWQFFVVTVVTLSLILVAGIIPSSGTVVLGGTGHLKFGVYLLLAVAVALTRMHFVDCTTGQIRRASQAMHPWSPELVARILMSQLAVPALGCLILALRPPASFLVELCQRIFGNPSLAAIVWPGAFSILAAGFGANAYAAFRAARR